MKRKYLSALLPLYGCWRSAIPAERITEESKDARVQPFAENNMNRASIMIAK